MDIFNWIINLIWKDQKHSKILLKTNDLQKLKIPKPKDDKRDFGCEYKTSVKNTSNDIDLSIFFPEIKNQLNSNSCVGQAVASVLEYYRNIETTETSWDLSDTQLWYDARKKQGWETKNEGCYIRDALSIVKNEGITLEELHPFKYGNWYSEPSELSRQFQPMVKISKYYQCVNKEEIGVTLNKGIPLVIAMRLYSNFYNNYGIYETKDGNFKGYHAMVIVGQTENYYKVRNSWGSKWSLNGHVLIDKDLLISLSRGIYAVEY